LILVVDTSAAVEYLLQTTVGLRVAGILEGMKIAAPELLDAEVLSVLRREVLAGHHGGRPALAPAGHRGDRSERAARLNASRRDRPCCFSRPLVYAPVKPHVTARRGNA